MTLLLEQAGFLVTSVSTGAEFLTLAKSRRFDLFLLNHTFPDASGVALCMGVRDYNPALAYKTLQQELNSDCSFPAMSSSMRLTKRENL